MMRKEHSDVKALFWVLDSLETDRIQGMWGTYLLEGGCRQASSE